MINRIRSNIEKEVNESQELISAIYKEFTRFGINTAHANAFEQRKLVKKCPPGKEDATPFDIRYGGDGLNALLEEAADIARSFKEGNPGFNVYFIENNYEKPLKAVAKEEVNISALTDPNEIIAALKKENAQLRNAAAGVGAAAPGAGAAAVVDDKNTAKKCSFCMTKLFRKKVNHSDAQCFYIAGNKGYIGQAEVDKKIKKTNDWKDRLVKDGKWKS